ncbi:hypothetical protein ACFQ08_11155, partial [Streptosporangium algeriense]
MLDNEPGTGVTGPGGDTEEQPKQAPRRRAASRPAGPPPEDLETAPSVVVITRPEPEPGPAEETAPAAAPEVTAPE